MKVHVVVRKYMLIKRRSKIIIGIFFFLKICTTFRSLCGHFPKVTAVLTLASRNVNPKRAIVFSYMLSTTREKGQ